MISLPRSKGINKSKTQKGIIIRKNKEQKIIYSILVLKAGSSTCFESW
jgi:hypothetical protein